MNSNAELLAAVAALAALPVSAFAAYLSKRADARSKVAARTQVYLTLRTRFFEVHSQLPPSYADPAWRPGSEDEKAAATRYWHHAFDEWYITTQLDPDLLRDLWRKYYSGALSNGLRHNGLRAQFLEMSFHRGEHDELWVDYAREVARVWAESHPRGTGACPGLACDHWQTPGPSPDAARGRTS
ncbi:MAG: hypothetical protein H6Q03_1529 [Acidobacteria bacterium]|nr:hypothetical protein [Acidobacteriota bacterium]